VRSKLREVAEWVCVIQRGDRERRQAAAAEREKSPAQHRREGRDAGNFTWRTDNKRQEDKGACFTGLQAATTSKETLLIQGPKSCRRVEDLGTWLGRYPQDLQYSRFDLFVYLL
jgi:hypothetical protein